MEAKYGKIVRTIGLAPDAVDKEKVKKEVDMRSNRNALTAKKIIAHAWYR